MLNTLHHFLRTEIVLAKNILKRLFLNNGEKYETKETRKNIGDYRKEQY